MAPERIAELARGAGLMLIEQNRNGQALQRFAALVEAEAYRDGERAERERIDNIVKDCEVTYTSASDIAPTARVKFDLRPLIRALPPSEGTGT